jgi:predicted XRE-type DNA-binding protein
MSTVVLEVPEDTFTSLPFARSEFARNTLLAACVKWVESGRLSQSRAAEICGVSRAAFLEEMSGYSVSPLQESVAEMGEALARG